MIFFNTHFARERDLSLSKCRGKFVTTSKSNEYFLAQILAAKSDMEWFATDAPSMGENVYRFYLLICFQKCFENGPFLMRIVRNFE